MGPSSTRGSNGSGPARAHRLRDEIDRGGTGDKVAFPDPAAAPLGTDAEAGGSPPTVAEVREAERREKARTDGAATNGAPADRRPSHSRGNARVLTAFAAAVAALFLVAIAIVGLAG